MIRASVARALYPPQGAMVASSQSQDALPAVLWQLGVRTSAATEWGWAIGRLAVIGAATMGAVLTLRGTALYAPLVSLLGLALSYNAILVLLLLRGRVATVFTAGFLLDNAMLLVGLTTLFRTQPQAVDVATMYIALYVVLIPGAARLGWKLGSLYAVVWLVWVTWGTLVYFHLEEQEVGLLVARLLFLGTATAVTLQLVGRLNQSWNQAEVLWHQAKEWGDHLQTLSGIAEAERRTLKAIQASMAEGLLVLDERQRLMYANPAALSMLGGDFGAGVGRPFHLVLRQAATRLQGDEAVERLCKLVERARGAPEREQIEVVAPERRDLLVTAFPIAAEEGKEPMVGLLVRDVTPEQDLLRRHQAFVSVASHEIRTPMTSILGFSELLLEREVSKDTLVRCLAHINRESQRLTAILDDLLSISRIHAGAVTLEIEEVPLRKVVEDVMGTVRAKSDQHTFVLQMAGPGPTVLADRARLIQVLTNLLDNAVKYSPDGGRVTVSAQERPEDGRVLVSVADQGIGIAPEDEKHLFTTFHRARRPETEGIPGTGLGLYIVKQLLEAMGGDIWVRSQLGQGTTFTFSLPMPMTQVADQSTGVPPDAEAREVVGIGHGREGS